VHAKAYLFWFFLWICKFVISSFLFRQKYLEIDIHAQCIEEFGLVALQKDDNVTPDLMIDCCKRLLKLSAEFKQLLRGTHLWITSGYYSVLSDGELCIPWDWNGSKTGF